MPRVASVVAFDVAASLASLWALYAALSWAVPSTLSAAFSTSFAVLVVAVVTGAFAIGCLLFALVDLVERPAWLRALKIQADVDTPSTKYRGVAADAARSFVLVVVPSLIAIVMAMSWRAGLRAVPSVGDPSPLSWAAAIALVVWYLSMSMLSWGVHKLLHTPWLWRTVHARHHDVVAPVAVSSVYAHPVEVVVWDLLPPLAAPLLLGFGPLLVLTVAIAMIAGTVVAHCGYRIARSSSHHDLHHERLRCNYASLLADWLMGTLLLREPDAVYPRYDREVKSIPADHPIHNTRRNKEHEHVPSPGAAHDHPDVPSKRDDPGARHAVLQGHPSTS